MKNNQTFFLSKLFILLFIFLASSKISFSQAGAKWATGGNGVSTGDFIGTTNNFPLIFKTNNAQKMLLSTSGVLQLNNLTGTGNRLLQTDASGNIIPFAMGTSTQVLYGNGTWGSLPTSATSPWLFSGSNIYYNAGNVGIGTSSPAYPLEVIGDARISNNLYVGGGIIITDKVNAASEVVTSSIKTDSIATDSTMGFYGTTKFNGDVKLQNKLAVNGDALINGATTVNGDFKTLGSLTFAGGKSISYAPGSASFPPLIGWGTPISVIGPSLPYCFSPTTPTPIGGNVFAGMLYSAGTSSTGQPNVLRMGYDGANGIIDIAGVGATSNPSLLLNYYCGMDIFMCTGSGGGYVATGKNFEVGNPVRSSDIAVNVNANNQTGLFVTTSHSTDFNYNTKLAVNRNNTKALAVYNTSTSTENFVIYGDGSVSIGTSSIFTDYKLTVNGNIRAKKVVVDLGWSDFVFEKKYYLRTLKEVETYIQENGHLPEIPSANEVETKGADLGNLVKLQMQKIEELTLYIIEQNKRIELLEKNKK